MRRLPALALPLAAAAMLSTGCYGPMYNNPYGNTPMYPGTTSPGPFYAPGTMSPGGATLGAPTFGNPTPVAPGSAGSGGGGDAPFYGSGSSTSNTSGHVPVPNYPDVPSPYYPPSAGGAGTSNTGLNSVPSGRSVTPAAGNSDNPFGDSGQASDSLDLFEKPTVSGREISFTRDVTDAASYGHDPQFRWLRGVVSRDPQDGSWGIVYSINPDRADTNGGFITLAGPKHVAGLKEGNFVRVEGRVDPATRDRFGKATYLVTSAAAVQGL